MYNYCKVLGDPHSISVMTKYVDTWWNDVVEAQKNGEPFTLLGQTPTSVHNQILSEIGVNNQSMQVVLGISNIILLKQY